MNEITSPAPRKKQVRTFSEILIDADRANNTRELYTYWDELIRNKHNYPLVELQFAHEHFYDLACKMAKNDKYKLKEFLDMMKSHK